MAREHKVTEAPSRPPVHPGEILREEVLPALRLTVAGAARGLGVSRQLLHRIISEQAGVSPEMALRLGKFCGNGPELWLAMQQAHDLWAARRGMAIELENIAPARRPS
jgi:addiction module HigA family antidote